MKRRWKRLSAMALAITLFATMPGVASYVWAGEEIQTEDERRTEDEEQTKEEEIIKDETQTDEEQTGSEEQTEDEKHAGDEEQIEDEEHAGDEEQTEEEGRADGETEEETQTGNKETGTGICEHHPEHDETCGYEETGECTYVCEICSEEAEEEEDDSEENLGDDTDSALVQSKEPGKQAVRSSVQTEDSVASVTIGGVTEYYDDFSKAWNAAQGKTATIRIWKNVDAGNKNLEINDEASDIILEIPDDVILSTSNVNSGINIKAGAFTLKGGTLLYTISSGKGVKINGGSFILDGGAVTTPESGTNTGVSVEDGIFEMKGGSIKASQYGLYLARSEAAISGGEIAITSGCTIFCAGIFANGGNTIHINEDNGDVKVTAADSGGVMRIINSDLEIGGGIFSGEKGYALSVKNCKVKISGGEFQGGTGGYGIFAEPTCSMEISGGTFSSGSAYSMRTSGDELFDWLAEGYAYYDMDNNIVERDNTPSVMEEAVWVNKLSIQHAIASVTVSGRTDYYYDIDTAWEEAQGKAATVKLFKSVDLESKTLEINDANSNITLEMAEGVVLERSKEHTGCVIHITAGSLTFASGTINFSYLGSPHAYGSSVIYMEGENSRVRVEGGTVTAMARIDAHASYVTGIMMDEGSLDISGGAIEIPGYKGVGVYVAGGRAVMEDGSIWTNCQGINVREGGELTVNGGKIAVRYWFNTGDGDVCVNGGSVVINGGTFEATATSVTDTRSYTRTSVYIGSGKAVINDGAFTANVYGVQIPSGSTGSLEIHGGTFTGKSDCGLFYKDKTVDVSLSGGIYTGNNAISSSGNLKEMLAEGYIYYALENGIKTPVNPLPVNKLSGTITVAKCEHTSYSDWQPDGSGSHTHTCENCSFEETEACDYKYSAVSDAGASGKEGHVGVCTFCAHETAQEAHVFTSWNIADAADSYVRTCELCNWQHTAEITGTPESLEAVYGKIGGLELSAVVAGAEAAYEWTLLREDGGSETLGTENGYIIPSDLSAESYTYKCAVTLEGGSEPTATLTYSLSVVQADIGEAAVTVEEGEGIFYTGGEKKPDITVTLNGKTLEEGVDYEILSYTDNVNAGTGTVTITGIGNYAKTASADFTIQYLATEAEAAAPEGWCNGAIISAPSGFTISDSLDGTFGESIFYGTETGSEGADVTYYLKQEKTGYITDVKAVRVKVDMTMPSVDGTGNGIKITDRDSWWQKLLSTISFGYYKPQKVIVGASDVLSGIDRICYYIDRAPGERPLTAEELDRLGADKWEASDTVSFQLNEDGRYVIYAYALDKAGNQSAYVCSDGIVIDSTPPTVTLAAPSQEKLGDTSATPAVKMNEAGTFTYILSNTEKSSITAQEILDSVDGVKRSVTAEQAGNEMELYFTGLKANSTYYVYAVGTDTAGNIGDVASLSFTTLKTALAGMVSIEGKAVYGETLTASAGVSTPDCGGISYQWYRVDENGNETPIGGAQSASYTLTAEDIGCGIRVKVTTENCSGDLTSQTESRVIKAGCPAENTPLNGKVNDALGEDTFTFTGKNGVVYEYSTDGGSTWKEMTDSDFTPEGADNTKVTGTIVIGNYACAAGQIQVRAKETNTLAAGESLKNATAFTASLEGSVSLEGAEKYGETLTASVSGAQPGVPLIYSFYREGETEPVQTGSEKAYTLTKEDIGKKISVKVTAADYMGELTAEGGGTVQKGDGKEISGTVTGSYVADGETYVYTVNNIAGAQYRMDDGPWQDFNVFTDIMPGTSHTFYARMKETDCYNAGAEKGTEKADFPKITPATPALQYQIEKVENGVITVIIVAVEGAEYSFDGGNSWASGEDANRKEYASEEIVNLAIRIKATEILNESPKAATEINLAKKPQGAPDNFELIYTANGESDYTVTIPATEGCEYSFDGVNWSENNTIKGTVGEVITGYKRYKKTGDSNVGSAVSASTVLPRFTVKTPVISPKGGSYAAGSAITVTIISETSGAEIYYTVDGSEPSTDSLLYTGAFKIIAPGTVKAMALKAGMTDSEVAVAEYEKKEENTEEDRPSQGDGDSKGENASKSEDGTILEGTGIVDGSSSFWPENTGTGNNYGTDAGNNSTGSLKPGGTGSLGSISGSGNKGSVPGDGKNGKRLPFIKPAEGTESAVSRRGWEIIRAEAEDAPEGDIINVDMNGTKVVPGNVLDILKNRDITITFDMDNGFLWRVNGQSIMVDKVSDIDFSVKTEECRPEVLQAVLTAVPADRMESIAEVAVGYRIYLSHQGGYGFTAVLSLNLGKENAGLYANLFTFPKDNEKAEFISAGEIAADGTAELVFVSAEDYVIVINEVPIASEEADETANMTGRVSKEISEKAKEMEDGSLEKAGLSENGESGKVPFSVMAGATVVLIAGAAGFQLLKRKK